MENSNYPVLSIITISFHNPEELQRTLDSVYYHFVPGVTEQIVIDGSPDNSCQDILLNYQWIDQVLHEKDRGRYDAMNKGIKLSKGKHLLFLNSGDELFSGFDMNELLKLLCSDSTGSVYYGDVIIDVGGDKYLKKAPRSLENHWSIASSKMGLPSHQATFYPSSFAKYNLYNLKYSISADTLFTLKALDIYPEYYINQVVTIFFIGGASNVKSSFKEVFNHWKERKNSRNKAAVPQFPALAKDFIKSILMRFMGWKQYYKLSYAMKPIQFKRIR